MRLECRIWFIASTVPKIRCSYFYLKILRAKRNTDALFNLHEDSRLSIKPWSLYGKLSGLRTECTLFNFPQTKTLVIFTFLSVQYSWGKRVIDLRYWLWFTDLVLLIYWPCVGDFVQGLQRQHLVIYRRGFQVVWFTAFIITQTVLLFSSSHVQYSYFHYHTYNGSQKVSV